MPEPARRSALPLQASRRSATPEEAKALASPLRLRIIRETLDTPLTNSEIAERVRRDKATVLHHVRVLVDNGFLVPGEPRRGTRGAREIPYHSTGKSWRLSMDDPAAAYAVEDAMVAAFVEELQAGNTLRRPAAEGPRPDFMRLAMRLTDADQAELLDRLQSLFGEFRGRNSPDGVGWAYFGAVYRRP